MVRHFKKNVYEAVLREKKAPYSEYEKMGDAVLVYPEKRFFAVADSPSHCPLASGVFLKRIQTLLDSKKPGIQTEISDRAAFPEEVKNIEGRINALIDTEDFNNRTTFTGLFLFPWIKKALLLHNGDSLLYHFHLDRDHVETMSKTNHCLIGKFPQIYQVKTFDYSEHSRLLLTTDGFSDILRVIRSEYPDAYQTTLLQILKNIPIDKFISELLRQFNGSHCLSDDLAIISLNPNTVLT